MSGTPQTPGMPLITSNAKREREEREDLGNSSQRRVEHPDTPLSDKFNPRKPDTWPTGISVETLKNRLEASGMLIKGLSDADLTMDCSYAIRCLQRGDKEGAASTMAKILQAESPGIAVQFQNLSNLKLFKRYHLICSTATEAMLGRRWPSIRDDLTYVELVAFKRTIPYDQKVNLFHGESGQGKTVAAVVSTFLKQSGVSPTCATFYFVADELVTRALADVLAKCAKIREENGTDEGSIRVPRYDRDSETMNAIAERVTHLLHEKNPKFLLQFDHPIVLGLVGTPSLCVRYAR